MTVIQWPVCYFKSLYLNLGQSISPRPPNKIIGWEVQLVYDKLFKNFYYGIFSKIF